MNLIIHDLNQAEWNLLDITLGEDTKVIDSTSRIYYCKGCFGCWLKTPGRCVVEDDCQKIGELLSETETLTLISRCTFGGYSSFVKKVLERTISYLLPFLEVVDKKMRHEGRYKNHIHIKSVFYGEDITETEKETARELVYANARNYGAETVELCFVESINEIREVLV